MTSERIDNPSDDTDGAVPSGELVSLASFRAGMRRLAAGVCLVTTSHDGQRHGFVATSVTSLAAEPPFA